jgi:hypothetical protein
MSGRSLLQSDRVAVYLAGSYDVNGLYTPTGSQSGGFPMFRKAGSNVGLLLFEDNRIYISDCGPAFEPSGPDHLDYYVSTTAIVSGQQDVVFKPGEDGLVPAPKARFVTEDSLQLLRTALRSAGKKHSESGETDQAMLHFKSLLNLGAPIIQDYLSLAELYLCANDKEKCWSTLGDLCKNESLLFVNGKAKYSKADRLLISDILLKSMPSDGSLASLISLLSERSLYPFIEFIIPLCEDLKTRMELEKLNENAYDESTIEKLIFAAEQRSIFQLSGGMEVAMNLRDTYRRIDDVTFDQRDTAVNRMRIFSLADTLRQFASDGKLDLKGRDSMFKSFWEAGSQKSAPVVVDPREEEARIKDLDPAKEMKCSVIKAINEQQEGESTDGFFKRRKELLAVAPPRVFSLDEVRASDCNNTELKLISIHGIVFDVTHNLEKYAPNGEYFFFPGHDITYPLAVSSLSGDHVDEFYKLDRPDHLKRVYGWMEYFVNKYKIVGRLGEYDKESSEWGAAPQGEDEPEMQCTIM